MINSVDSNTDVTTTPAGVRPKPQASLLVQGGLMFLTMTALTGVLYPLAVTLVAQTIYHDKAQGSLIYKSVQAKSDTNGGTVNSGIGSGTVLGNSVGNARADGTGLPVGSQLLGQSFTAPEYFYSRPSATSVPYDAAASSGSNLAASNKTWSETVAKRVATLQQETGKSDIPVDLVTASGSGLDPDISPAAASVQVERVAKARHLAVSKVQQLLASHIQPRQFGLLGEPRVNVLKLNLALDSMVLADRQAEPDKPMPR